MTQEKRAAPELAPGSDDAIDAGCTCPVLDNAHGLGYMGRPGMFIMSEGCPLHARPTTARENQDAE